MLNTNGESSGDATLRFAVGNAAIQSYSGAFSVTAKDAFGAIHTSSGTITLNVSNDEPFDVVAFFQLHPLYIIFMIVVIAVLLAVLVLFSKRRR